VLIKNNHLYLPNSFPIPNDGSGKGLKHRIDTWLAANSANPGEPTVSASQLQITATSQYDPPLHIALSLEIVQSENPDSNDEDSKDDNAELYNMFEVLAAEQKKRDARPSRLPEAAPPLTSSCATTPSTVPKLPPPNAGKLMGAAIPISIKCGRPQAHN